MNGPGRWLRTLSRLAPGQARGRLVHEVRRRARAAAPRLLGLGYRARPGAAVGPAPLPPPDPGSLAAERALAERWCAGEVCHLGSPGPAGWAVAGRPRLWRYEHQYHRELLALAALAASEPAGPWAGHALSYLEGWAVACPPVTPDAWEPYPVARRLLTWSVAALLHPALRAALAPGLAAQRIFLARNLEHHLGGNHLLTEAAALVAAAASLDGRPGLGPAVALLGRELEAQVLPDGGHLERTARYHAAALHDAALALLLCRRAGPPPAPAPLAPLGRLARWLEAVRRPDGSLPGLNDALDGGHPTAAEALSLAGALGVAGATWDGWLGRALAPGEGPGPPAPPTAPPAEPGDLWLPDTGWALVREGGHELLFDTGPLGPDEQPGHGHSDALGFELRWGGRSVVQDSGASTYQAGPVRAFERSAAAHACVTVDGAGADELWSAFRAGARGRVSGAPPVVSPRGVRRLRGRLEAPGGWSHQREVAFRPGRALVVHDEVSGAAGRRVESHLPLAPGAVLEGERLVVGDLALRLQVLVGRLRPGEGWVAGGLDRRRGRASPVIEAVDGRVVYALLADGASAGPAGDWCSLDSQ